VLKHEGYIKKILTRQGVRSIQLKKKTLFFILFFSTALFPAFPYNESLWVPRDHKKVWTVGISSLKGVGISPENSYLLRSLPLLMLEKLSRCEQHFFSEEEKEGYRQSLMVKEKEKVKKELSLLYNAFDKLLFNVSAKKQEERLRLSKGIEEMKSRLDFLSKVSFGKIEIPEVKPVQFFKKTEREERTLLPPPLVSAKETSERMELDFLIWGVIEEIEGYFYLELRCYQAAMDREVFIYRNAASESEINSLAEEAAKKIITHILGRDWANLNISAEPEEAEIRIDGRFYGIGEVDVDLIERGEHLVEVTAPGYRKRSVKIDLFPLEEKDLNIKLEEKEKEWVSVTTYPLDAEVYVSSRWQGRTPIQLEKTDRMEEVRVGKDSYLNYSFIISEKTPKDIKITLPPDIIKRNELIREKRNKFYSAAGLFVASVPLPIIFYGLALDNGIGGYVAYVKGDKDELVRLWDRTTFFYNSYIGSMVVCTSLFVNTLIHLIDYIALSDKTSRTTR